MIYFAEIKPEPASNIEIINLFSYNSGSESRCEYLRIKESKSFEVILNLRLATEYGSAFKQAMILDDLLLVGYGERFALYDYKKHELKAELVFSGYFGSFIVDSNEIFVATDSDLFNLSKEGKVNWISENLGIDGVLIGRISDRIIEGTGEFDPPGGWIPFVVDRTTGIKK